MENISYFVSQEDTVIYDAINKGIINSNNSIIGLLHSDDKFYSKMSNETLEIILDIKALLSDDVIRNTWAYCEKNLQANGSIKKAN